MFRLHCEKLSIVYWGIEVSLHVFLASEIGAVETTVFCVVTPCISERPTRFRRIYRLRFQDRRRIKLGDQ